jgi:hypothetical protein
VELNTDGLRKERTQTVGQKKRRVPKHPAHYSISPFVRSSQR